MHPLSTRTLVTARSGLAAGIEDLAPLSPPALVLEAPSGAGSLASAEAVLRRIRCPVVACVGPILEAPRRRGVPPSLASADAEARKDAAADLGTTLEFMARVRCLRLVIESGTGDVSGIDGARGNRNPAAAASDAVAAWARGARRDREAAVERLCRSLDAVARAVPAVRLLLLPGSDPFSLLDLETTEWILDDLRFFGVHLAFDTGHLGLRETQGGPKFTDWLDRHSAKVDLFLLSDHDGRARSDLLPGTGRLDFQILRGILSHHSLRVVRPDPGVSSAACRDTDSYLVGQLGPPSAA